MRARFLSLTMAAVAVSALLAATASAQFRNYYNPNFSNSIRQSQMSSFGMSNNRFVPSNYGNPSAGPIGSSYAGTLNSGSAIPLGSVGNLQTLSGAAPLGGGFGTMSIPLPPSGVPLPTNTPLSASNAMPLNPNTLMQPASVPEAAAANPANAINNPANPANPINNPANPANPINNPANAVNPAAPETIMGAPAFIPPQTNAFGIGPAGTTATGPSPYFRTGTVFQPTYIAPYTAPQYQSSFYAPLRRLYGSQGY